MVALCDVKCHECTCPHQLQLDELTQHLQYTMHMALHNIYTALTIGKVSVLDKDRGLKSFGEITALRGHTKRKC